MNQHGGEKYQVINRFSLFARNTKVAMLTAPPSQLRGLTAKEKQQSNKGRILLLPPTPLFPPYTKTADGVQEQQEELPRA